MFLILMVIGLVGLLVMALPAFGRHGAAGIRHHVGHAVARAGHVGVAAKAVAARSHASAGRASTLGAPESATGVTRFLPSPRVIFSLLALYGAFANALEHAAHLTSLVAALVAIVPAVAVERFAVAPVWNLLFRFQGQPSSPLEALILSEASAVTTFPNGRGMVTVIRDGRAVQFSARLVDKHAGATIRVGDRLRVEDVDARNERLTVSLAEH